MLQTSAYHIKLEGDNYTIGQTLGQMVKDISGLAQAHVLPTPALDPSEANRIYNLFDKFCPGLNEEAEGFCDVLKAPRENLLYYALTYLRPGCSQMAVLPTKTTDGHTILARNYDFTEQLDDMMLTTTRVTGRYAHISSSSILFGRCDGMNERGLAVSMTSAGLPVANFEQAVKRPAIEGLNFGAVVRSVLENCANCNETVLLTRDMPIAFNINLLTADKQGNAVLIETVDGKMAVKQINNDSNEHFIMSTNHVCLPELTHLEAKKLKHSLARYELIRQELSQQEKVSSEMIKTLLTTPYPQGLSFDFYDEYLGTLRSIIFDSTAGEINICFGSPDINPWYKIKMGDEFGQGIYPVTLRKCTMGPEIFAMV